MTSPDPNAEDLLDLALVLARSATDDGSRTSLEDVLAAFGHTRDTLATIPDEGLPGTGHVLHAE